MSKILIFKLKTHDIKIKIKTIKFKDFLRLSVKKQDRETLKFDKNLIKKISKIIFIPVDHLSIYEKKEHSITLVDLENNYYELKQIKS